jgi:hypothetical protein
MAQCTKEARICVRWRKSYRLKKRRDEKLLGKQRKPRDWPRQSENVNKKRLELERPLQQSLLREARVFLDLAAGSLVGEVCLFRTTMRSRKAMTDSAGSGIPAPTGRSASGGKPPGTVRQAPSGLGLAGQYANVKSSGYGPPRKES